MGHPAPVIKRHQIFSMSDHEVEAEKERIKRGGIFATTKRDEQLFKWLDIQKDCGNSGFIYSDKGSGISDSCQYYRLKNIKLTGNTHKLTASVVYIRVPSVCSITTFCSAALQSLKHPFHKGKLKNLRPDFAVD
jgi:hypothetical protein